jgi:hypothetical protein
VLANRLGYAPQGLHRFLTRLQERNKGATEKRGLFASHPEMNERLERLTRQITSQKLAGMATVADRYRKTIPFKPVPQSGIATVAAGSAGLTGGSTADAKPPAKAEEKKEEPQRKRGFGGIGRVLPGGGGERRSEQTTASAATRGVDPERDARGGANPAAVPVRVTVADVAAFKKAGGLT